MTDHAKILEFIARCNEPDKLRALIKNARDQGGILVADAAFRKLVSLVPSERPGTIEHDFWQTVHAFEYVLAEERGRTTRLTRTRQKVAKVGVRQTLKDWALSGKDTEGFKMLLERGMAELTGEAIVLRHAPSFEPLVVEAARERLSQAGVDVDSLAKGLRSDSAN